MDIFKADRWKSFNLNQKTDNEKQLKPSKEYKFYVHTFGDTVINQAEETRSLVFFYI